MGEDVAPTVVGLGAWCDYRTEDEERAWIPGIHDAPEHVGEALENFRRGLSFDVDEFAELSDGRRVTLHRGERGFSSFARAVGGGVVHDQWDGLTVQNVEQSVLTTVLPDDADHELSEQHPWDWLVDLLRAQGVDASRDDLRRVPYRVELSDRLRTKLSR